MANLEEILSQLNAEPVVEAIDWDAPEAGQFPPRLAPGTYSFVFSLPKEADKQFDLVEIPKASGHKYLSVTHEAEFVNTADPSKPIKLNFCRANTYKHEKMAISSMGDLLRSIGQRLDTSTPSATQIVDALRAADGRASGRAEIGWSRYCKACDHTVSTHPRKDQTKWPRDTDGKPVAVVACPNCGDRGYGREEIMRYKLPEKT